MFLNSVSDNYFSFSFQFDDQKDQVAVEQILRVVFLDVDHPTPVRVCLLCYEHYSVIAGLSSTWI